VRKFSDQTTNKLFKLYSSRCAQWLTWLVKGLIEFVNPFKSGKDNYFALIIIWIIFLQARL